MRCRILHESTGRMRVHLIQHRMTPGQADILQFYLQGIPGIDLAKVHERTMNAIIYYKKGARERAVRALADFSYETAEAVDAKHAGRELQRRYEDKFFFLLARRAVSRLLFPAPLRSVMSVFKSVRFIAQGIRTLAARKVEVPVLDAVSIGAAVLTGDFNTAGSVMFLLETGELLEDWTRRKSIGDLARRMYLNVDKVWLQSGGTEELVPVTQVKPDDVIVVRTGSVIPLDGVVVSGEASVNQASMTGESLPVRKEGGGFVYAGTVLEEGGIAIRVKHAVGSGRYDRIVHMIEESGKLKSQTESRASHLADQLVPYSLGAALLTAVLTRSLNKALSILMVDYSCALKLAMPISVLSAMRECSSRHIDVKGGKFMEAVSDARTIVFDKTGTLTHAAPQLRQIVTFEGRDEAEMLRLAACLEEHFPHSIANAVVEAARVRGLVHAENHAKVEYVVAHGIASFVGETRVLIGSYHFIFEDEKCRIPEGEGEVFESLPDECTHLYLALGGFLAAVLCIEDPVRAEAAAVVRGLRALGFDKVVMMTGDGERTARSVAERIGIDEYYAQVLPEDKAGFIRREHENGRKVVMIGDGINDSPALSEADAGVAISAGAAIAREIADINISADDLAELLVLRTVSDRLMTRIRRNYRFILSFNTALIALGLGGFLQPSASALLHNVSTLAVGMKSMTNLLPKSAGSVTKRLP